jgi:hypothetical protein
MILRCSDFAEKHQNARFKGWSKVPARVGCTVTTDSDRVVACIVWGNPSVESYTIGFDDDPPVRIVPRKEVIPTVRLYLDAQRLRHSLDVAKKMIVSPV